MRIGLISDTHGSLQAMRKAVVAVPPVDMWLHAGDFSQDSSFLSQVTGIPVTAVRGNCDGVVTAKPDEQDTAKLPHIAILLRLIKIKLLPHFMPPSH